MSFGILVGLMSPLTFVVHLIGLHRLQFSFCDHRSKSMQPSPTIAIVYADGFLNDESEETQPISGCGRRLVGYRNKVVEEDRHEEYSSSQDANHGTRRKGAATGEYTGSSSTRQHGEPAYYDLDEEAGKVTVVAAAGEQKIDSFATAAVTESDDDDGSIMIPESARLEEITTTATQRQWHQHQDQLEPNLLIILPTIQVLGVGRRGDETTTISTLSFGYNKAAPVHVVTPRETPWNYFGIGLALIVSAVSAFLVAFCVVLRR
jgi:hypothetical protein